MHLHPNAVLVDGDHIDELVLERLPSGAVAWLRPAGEPERYTITDAGRALLTELEIEAAARANANALLFGSETGS